jgi:CDP-glucose 4,6-dehydratase
MSDRWSGRRVLITGHTGFKGAWLAWWLARRGARVAGLALPPEAGRPNLFAELRLGEIVESTLGDVRDAATVGAVFARARPEFVFHLAAQAIVRVSYAVPRDTWETNVLGTATVLDAVREANGVRAVVVVTSDKCYENRGLARGYCEDDPLGGRDPYSASKAAQELVAASYRASYLERGPLLATVRAGNVIGGGDWSRDRLIPDVVRALADEAPVALRFPDAVRPWQHVLEPLHAYLVVAERLAGGDRAVASAFNIGPRDDDHRTVAGVVERMCREWGGAAGWTRVPGTQLEEAAVLRLDATKAARTLGITPRFGLDEACARTAAWYRDWSGGADARRLCDADLAAFEAAPCPV